MITTLLALCGAIFILLAGVGVLRMPDVYSRMQAAGKAATMGVVLLALAAAWHFAAAAVIIRVVLICVFVLVTAPLAAHVMARAGYAAGVPMDPREARIDELEAISPPRAARPRR
jgi:multicomponent Na+:H+ antiporter subunit G